MKQRRPTSRKPMGEGGGAGIRCIGRNRKGGEREERGCFSDLPASSAEEGCHRPRQCLAPLRQGTSPQTLPSPKGLRVLCAKAAWVMGHDDVCS